VAKSPLRGLCDRRDVSEDEPQVSIGLSPDQGVVLELVDVARCQDQQIGPDLLSREIASPRVKVRSFERLVVGPGCAAEPGPTAAREWFIHAVDQPDPASGYDVSVDVRGPTPGCGVVGGKRERFGRRNAKLP
jgi:hypothetical protein